jgi:hypothetical protein
VAEVARILNRLDREQTARERACGYVGRNIPGRKSSMSKGPGVGAYAVLTGKLGWQGLKRARKGGGR